MFTQQAFSVTVLANTRAIKRCQRPLFEMNMAVWGRGRAFRESANRDFFFRESGNQPEKSRESVIWKSPRYPLRIENYPVKTGIKQLFSDDQLMKYFPWLGSSTLLRR